MNVSENGKDYCTVFSVAIYYMHVAVRPLEVMTNILIRSMGPVSEENMVSNFVPLSFYNNKHFCLHDE